MKLDFRARPMQVALICLVIALQSCTPRQALMPTPNVVYQTGNFDLNSLNPELKNSSAEILFLTDRNPYQTPEKSLAYGINRSSSLSFGTATVAIGKNLSWQQLLNASNQKERRTSLVYSISNIVEHGRYPATPYLFDIVDGRPVEDTRTQYNRLESNTRLTNQIVQRLKTSDKKELVLFVHGYNNSFDEAQYSMAGIWHFLGRNMVPVTYSWPAGQGGTMGYFIDRESGEYTIFHLKEVFRLLFSIKEIEKIHIVAHSRGAVVVTSALRELLIESLAKGEVPRNEFRIANLILAAPDMDFGIMAQRLMAEKFAAAVHRITIYTTKSDKALSFSKYLLRGVRFGQVGYNDLSDEQKRIFARIHNVSIVQAQDVGSFVGHSYFEDHPAVSSDLIITLNTSAIPGSKIRPLTHSGGNVWKIPRGYPNLNTINSADK